MARWDAVRQMCVETIARANTAFPRNRNEQFERHLADHGTAVALSAVMLGILDGEDAPPPRLKRRRAIAACKHEAWERMPCGDRETRTCADCRKYLGVFDVRATTRRRAVKP